MSVVFSDRARRVMQLANQEAQRFNHEYIGTEHILLGLVKEGNGIAAAVIKDHPDVDLRKIRIEVEKCMQTAPQMNTIGRLPLTPKADQLVCLAQNESKSLGLNYVGTEHLFLAMADSSLEDTVVGIVLKKLGFTHSGIRASVLNVCFNLSKQLNIGTTSLADPNHRLVQELALGKCLSRVLGQLGIDASAQREIAQKCESDAAKAWALLVAVFASRVNTESTETTIEAQLGSSLYEHLVTLIETTECKLEDGWLEKRFEMPCSTEQQNELRAAIVSEFNIRTE